LSTLEIIAVIFTLVCVALTVIRNVWCWPIGIIGVTAYFFLFFQTKLYADMGLQVIYFAQGVYGWYFWLYGKKADDEEVPIRRLSRNEILTGFAAIGCLIIAIGFLTSTFTDTDVAYLDATVASVSLVANMLLARKIIDNWVLWITVDVVYVFLFAYKGLYLSSGLYALFFFMAIAGLIGWRKKWLQQKAELEYAS
jgi:nicotinamide mononucleotide transporter